MTIHINSRRGKRGSRYSLGEETKDIFHFSTSTQTDLYSLLVLYRVRPRPPMSNRRRKRAASATPPQPKRAKVSAAQINKKQDQNEKTTTVNIYLTRQPTTILPEYLYFLLYRMHVWARMYPGRATQELVHEDGTPFIIREADPIPIIPSEYLSVDNLLVFSTFGNAYRHLDSGTHRVGEAVRLVVGDSVDSDPDTWSNEQIARALLMCVLNGAGFVESTVQECFPQWKHITVEALPMRARLPSTLKQVKKFGRWLNSQHNKEQKEKGSACSPLFSGRSQDVGRQRWANYLTEKSKKKYAWTDFHHLTTYVVPKIRNATTWMEGLNALMTMNGAGHYVGGQAFCDLFFGVWKSKSGLFFHHEQVRASMEDETGAGPGPRRSLESIFGLTKDFMNKDENLILGLKGLCQRLPFEFQKLGIDFPYLSNQNDDKVKSRALSCVDLEHSMCYFHRYLKAKNNLGKTGMTELKRQWDSDAFKNIKRQPIKKFSKIASQRGVKSFCNKLLEKEKARKGGVL